MPDGDSLSRRQYLQRMIAAGACWPTLLSLGGCSGTQICPDEQSESGGVDWVPDVLHPVFWGFQTLGAENGAPGPLRVYYPTFEGTPQNAAILKLCLIRYPVVLFMHGMPPPQCSEDDYFTRWQFLGTVLARSGYVVVMPKHGHNPFPGSADIEVGLAALDFVRGGWEHSNWVDGDVAATAVIGHSYGALIAARLRQARPTIGAFVGLSGVWSELADFAPLLQSIQVPAFFSWSPTAGGEDLDPGGVWDQVPGRKWAAIFGGEHFDYINPYPGCDFPRGDCNLIGHVMAELVALFLSVNLPTKGSDAPIPWSLRPPTVTLTQKQAFFSGQHLNGIELISSRAGCGIDLRWEFAGFRDSRHLGP